MEKKLWLSTPPRNLPIVKCPSCLHPINEHLSTESAGEEGGGLNGCEHVPDGSGICACYWTPNDIAAHE